MKRLSDAECRHEIIEKIVEIVKEQLPEEKAIFVAEFIRQYYSHVALTDLQERNPMDLYGAALSHWNYLSDRKPGEVKLRILNPSFEEHGWSSTHTIIQLAQDDMPFLVDSMTMELNRLGYTVHLIIHIGNMMVERGKDFQVIKLHPHYLDTDDGTAEAPIYIEIDRQTDPVVLRNLKENLLNVLKDVRYCVEDWKKMRERVYDLLAELDANKNLNLDYAEIEETKEFLRFMVNDHFTFIGCRDYEMIGQGEDLALKIVPGSGLGVLRETEDIQTIRKFSEMPAVVRSIALSKRMVTFAKQNRISTVHRPAYTDSISIKRFDDKGNPIGERRFIGLFTSTAYSSRPKDIPLLRDKVQQILSRSRLSPIGHSGKALLHILETFPRDDLFQATVDELYDICMEILHMQERPQIRLFARKDIYNRFISCLVYVPRELYNTELREHMQKVLADSFKSNEITFLTQFSESVLARIHFMIRISAAPDTEYDIHLIEKRLIEVGRSWKHELREHLKDYYGEEVGNELAIKYGNAFPASYRETFTPRTAVYDIQHLECLVDCTSLEMSLYQPVDDMEARIRFKLFRQEHTIPLSDVLPVLENMGLRVIGEEPYEIHRKDGSILWINDFNMVQSEGLRLELAAVKDIFQEAFRRVWFGNAENDGFNYLVLAAHLDWRQISLLRAYAKYFRQIGFTFSQSYIEETLSANTNIVKQLVEQFYIYFDPESTASKDSIQKHEQTLEDSLDKVANLDEDRILRRFYEVIKATMRVNFFQKDEDEAYKSYISLKFNSKLIPELPLPYPMFEIFVYSPRFEGVHLRGAKVARGGLRWSDRKEDFRTEILGLMKAQQVKNAVIVPQGAKGGFVAKNLSHFTEREEIMEEGIHCYKNFIRGLLDITDNLKAGEIIPPKDIVRYDDDDPYLVVAADKGTATFSDIANSISEEYGFWLGDAFASGGSTGYDHKKMGITARGAWESVKRHFRHLGRNTQEEEFTVVGIGDMAGDVFGNGLLLSKCAKLVAAFNHLHIFIDPEPDPEVSFKERKRLFHLPRSSWEDYNPKLISKGGGVYSRSLKFIKITQEMKGLFEIDRDFLTPTDLIRSILKSPVDLLWNGGIGTFVKSSNELNHDVGDRANDGIRVNAEQLQCKVIGEGGNLGLTQLARVEYELETGGHIYTDFIDNSAGVDCSDHEVNIKILLNDIVNNGDMTEKQRNELLSQMTEEISELVLANNYHQTLSIEMAMHRPPSKVDLYNRYITELERHDRLDRELEFLPSEKEMLERKSNNKGLTRPEVAILLAYSKNILKEKILNSNIPELPELSGILKSAFPIPLREKYWSQLKKHSLRREIIATQLGNLVINDMGSAFNYRIKNEVGASTASTIRSYLIAQKIFARDEIWSNVESLDNKVSADIQIELLLDGYRLIQRGARWFLRNRHHDNLDVGEMSEYFNDGVNELKQILPELLVGTEKEEFETRMKTLIEHGVDTEIAFQVTCCPHMYAVLDIIESAKHNQFAIKELAEFYYVLGEKLELSWFRKTVQQHNIENHWEALARSALMDDLDRQQCNLSVSVLQFKSRAKSPRDRIEAWLKKNRELVKRWELLLADLKSNTTTTFTMYLVAIRELSDLINTSMQSIGKKTRRSSKTAFNDMSDYL